VQIEILLIQYIIAVMICCTMWEMYRIIAFEEGGNIIAVSTLSMPDWNVIYPATGMTNIYSNLVGSLKSVVTILLFLYIYDIYIVVRNRMYPINIYITMQLLLGVCTITQHFNMTNILPISWYIHECKYIDHYYRLNCSDFRRTPGVVNQLKEAMILELRLK